MVELAVGGQERYARGGCPSDSLRRARGVGIVCVFETLGRGQWVVMAWVSVEVDGEVTI